MHRVIVNNQKTGKTYYGYIVGKITEEDYVNHSVKTSYRVAVLDRIEDLSNNSIITVVDSEDINLNI